MADFCKQCSLDTFGEDFGDLKDLVDMGAKLHTICEGCGVDCIVDYTGTCVSKDCFKKHGTDSLKELL